MNRQAERIVTHLARGSIICYAVAALLAGLTIWCCFTPLLRRYNVRWKSGRPVRWPLVGACMLLVLSGLVLAGRSNQIDAEAFRRYGVVGTAVVFETKRQTGLRLGRGARGRRKLLRYRYRISGHPYAGERVYPNDGSWNGQARVGRRFLLLYNAKNPSKSILDLSTPIPDDSSSLTP